MTITSTVPSFIGINHKSKIYDGGNGTEQSPYRIVKLRHYNNVRRNPNAWFRQENDLIFTDEFEPDGEYYNNGACWLPMGDFGGRYDGQGFKIENLRSILNPFVQMQGSFARHMVGSSQLKNIYFKNIHVDATTSSVHIGGLVGFQGTAAGCVIEGVFMDGYVRAGTRVGGMVGRNCRLVRCGANLTMVFVQVAGGLVGGSSTMQYIDDCYSRGSMSATNHRAAVHGSTFGARIYRTYSTVLLTGGAGHLKRGIISAYDGYDGKSWDCYWDTQATTASLSNNYGGGLTVGLNTAQSKYPYPAYNANGDQGYAGWDFDTIWAHDTDGTINDGYPYLRGVTPIPE